MKNLALLAATSLILTSCATLFSGSTQTLNITTSSSDNSSIEDASCTVRDGEGMKYSVKTPGSTIVSRGSGGLIVECNKAGFKTAQQSVPQKVNPVTFINILFWPGFIVDAVSGTMQKYPSNVSLVLDKK